MDAVGDSSPLDILSSTRAVGDIGGDNGCIGAGMRRASATVMLSNTLTGAEVVLYVKDSYRDISGGDMRMLVSKDFEGCEAGLEAILGVDDEAMVLVCWSAELGDLRLSRKPECRGAKG